MHIGLPASSRDGLRRLARAAAVGSDDDMFADSDEERPSGAAQPSSTAAISGADAAAGNANAAPLQPQAGAGSAESGVTTAAGGASAPAEAIVSAASGAAAPAQSDAPGGAHAQAEAAVDYAAWPVSELKRVLSEAGVAIGGIVDKAGLVEAAAAADRARARVAAEIPAGFAMDPASGYFHDADTGWYFHAETGCYYRDGKWFSKDAATGAMVELQASAG